VEAWTVQEESGVVDRNGDMEAQAQARFTELLCKTSTVVAQVIERDEEAQDANCNEEGAKAGSQRTQRLSAQPRKLWKKAKNALKVRKKEERSKPIAALAVDVGSTQAAELKWG
jgi:hypothetical protein